VAFARITSDKDDIGIVIEDPLPKIAIETAYIEPERQRWISI
jgi:hypothetical protein